MYKYVYLFPPNILIFFGMCLIIHNILALSFVEERQQSNMPQILLSFYLTTNC